MIVARHVHVATSARPDRVYATGVVQPYPLYADPRSIAIRTIQAFTSWATKEVPQALPSMAPADVAARAQQVAMAIAGKQHVASRTDPRITYAAHLMLGEKPFVLRSGGKAAVIKAQAPGSWARRTFLAPQNYGVGVGAK